MTAHSCEVLQPVGLCYRCDLNRDEIADDAKRSDAIEDALEVIVRTPHIRVYLKAFDPKALEQAEAALL